MMALVAIRATIKSGLIAALIGCTAAAIATADERNAHAALPDDATSDQAVVTPIPRPAETDLARVALGRTLFGDTRLSHAGDRSCQFCHDITTNGAGGTVKAAAPDGTPLARNTNTVFNAALSFRYEWDGKVRTLEEQAELALTRSDFLATTWSEILGKLRADTTLVERFRQAYGRDPDRENVLDAIVTFERTLLTPDSRFDDWLRGNRTAITEQERAGYELFRGIGCASCHQGVNVGGNLFQKVGIFGPLPHDKAEVLRVPSLRNVAVTPPYFDDGSAATLPEAVRRMAKAQLGRQLDDAQIETIVAFLKTLTGSYQGRPLAAHR